MSKESAFEIGRLFLPIKMIADTLTASQKDVFVRLPGLVAYWPSGIRASGAIIDHSGGGNPLTMVGNGQVGYDGNAYAHLGGGTNYFWSPTASLAPTGVEAWVEPSIRGMTIGCWFALDASPSTAAGILTKDGNAPQRGYSIWSSSGNVPAFNVSGTGGSSIGVNGSTFSLSTWTFLVGRFIPSTEIAIFTNGDKTVNTAAIPASLFGSSQAFELGRLFGNSANIVTGRIRDAFVCSAALSDQLIEEIRVTSVP